MSAKQRIIGFFAHEISMHVLPDIDRLTNEIRPDAKGLRGCTVPLGMMVFAIIDLFGYLMRDDKQANKRETLKNFTYLFSKTNAYFPELYHDNCEKIVKLFRHGLIHQFFPKASGITKAGFQQPLIFEKSGIPNLNVDVLSADLTAALGKIKQYIIEDHDENMVIRMNERLDKLSKEDYDDLNA